MEEEDEENEEMEELFHLARRLAEHADIYRNVFGNLIDDMRARVGRADNAADLERVSETFGRSLRHLWLEASVASTSRNYRSPPTEQKTKTATGRNIEFGYERDLQPTYLEDRCATFFDSPPEGWSADHILLSSGQSAMGAVLHALESSSLTGSDGKLSFIHLGSYYETVEIFTLFRSLLKPVGRGPAEDADLFIIEPVFCDGEFGVVDVASLIEQHGKNARRRIYIFDTTLSGSGYSVENDLASMRALNPPAVFRLVSGLKLLQGGLELSGVGILTVFTPDGAEIPARQLGDRIRKIRTLLGLGLSFADVAALEAPWFLDRDYTRKYQDALFGNNARLAMGVSADNQFFRGVFHPTPRDAPYCVFRLRDRDPRSYAALEELLRSEAQKRGILFELGGSFGFRGHRFEVVRPEDGSEPFLRVALGRRSGWSCDRAIELLCDLASGRLQLPQ